MADKMTDGELVARLKLLEEHGTIQKAAEAAGVAARVFQTSIAKAKAKGLTAHSAIVSEEDRLRNDVQRLQAEVNVLRKDSLDTREIRRVIYGIAEHSPAPPNWLIEGTKRGKKTSGIPMTLWSDWHWGETVNPEENGGVNEFNREIGKERARKLVENIIDLCFNHMTTPNYPGIVVCLGGDMISGDIHHELSVTNDGYVQQCVMELEDVLIWGIETLADKFGKVFVPCVVGNHGRMTLKPVMKGRVFQSFEWNLYCHLAKYFRNDSRVTFFIPNETDAHFTVLGHRFLLTHGDALGVKGGDGIIGAIGPIMRGTMKVHRSEAQIGRDFDTILMGHWHQYIPLPGLIVNGTLKGYDEFARLALRAPYDRPSQSLWFVHPKHGITAQWPVYLEQKRQATETKTHMVAWEV